MLEFFIAILLLVLVLQVWDLTAKCAVLQHRADVSAVRFNEMEERRVEAENRQTRDCQDMFDSTRNLGVKMAALERRVDALHARLDILEEPKADDQKGRDNPKVRAAVDAFMSSFRA